jgi:hypothetical protein
MKQKRKLPRLRERERVAQPVKGREGNNKSGRPSSLLDTRVVYCGDNLEQLKKCPTILCHFQPVGRVAAVCKRTA